jgi:hypothetical protein
MGQKSNVLTIRKSNIQFVTQEEKSKKVGELYVYLNLLQKLFFKSDVCLLKTTIQFNLSKVYVNLHLFFRTRKIIKLKKKISTNRFKNSTDKRSSINILKLLKVFSNSRLIVLSTNVLNRNLVKDKLNSKTLLLDFFKFYNRYAKLLFPRRLNFFLDFIKLSVLLFKNKINCNFFIKILSEIFSILQKKRHSLYLQFIKFFFSSLIKYNTKKFKNLNKIVGIKFSISGKLKGKARADSNCMIIGNIPIQTLSANIEYSKVDTFTIYGVFGFKLWINRKVQI